MPTRAQKRWSGRLRTAGALMLLAGAVAAVDQLLPRAPDPRIGLGAAALLLPVGAVLFVLGRRWNG